MGSFNLKNLPTTPLVIGAVITLMGCVILAGIVYALAVPRTPEVALSNGTATRSYVTATPIVTMTPTATNTPPATPTDLPTDVPTSTPTHPPVTRVTRVPPTPAPPTNTPVPPTQVYGAGLGLDELSYSMKTASQGKGLTIPFYIKAHNSTDHRVPFGYLGVAAQDSSGATVAFTKIRINSFFEPDEIIYGKFFLTIDVPGQFMTYFVICVSANDKACDAPGADYRVLAPPAPITITN